MRSTRIAAEDGFTLIEVLVAAVILMLGAFAAFQLVDGASRTTSSNSARIGATNLTRELSEFARGTDYDQLQPATLETALRANASVAGSGSPWTVTRRGVTYTISASVCTFDDPKDGLAAAAPGNPCTAASALNTKVDQNPDDFRRVTLKVDWRARARTGSMTQTALIVNPAGGLGPRITRFDEPANKDFVTEGSIDWGGASTLRLTSTSAAAVHWTADDGVSQGVATGGPTDWAFSWNLGTPKLSPITIDSTWVADGNYTVQAQAVDSRGVPGEARVVTVHVNRHVPAAVQAVQGGYNARFGGVVDLRWQRYPERDVRGYQVYRSDGSLVCPSDGSAYITQRTCTDSNPGGGGTQTYTVYAMDCTNLYATACAARKGAPATLPVTLSTGLPLIAPLLVTATISEGLPKLDWPAVPGAAFYRIYRDTGTALKDRYDETITSSPTYTDPNPGATTQHTYWVTAVDGNFNESAPSLPVTSP